MDKKIILKKVVSKLLAKTEEERDAEYDAIKENKEDLVKYLSEELNKKGFKSSVDIEGNSIFLEVETKKGDKLTFEEDGTFFKINSGTLFLYDLSSKKNIEIKFELDDDLNFKKIDLSKLIVLLK